MQDNVEGSSVFDVRADKLHTFAVMETKKRQNVRDLFQTSNSTVLLKFCDVCKYLNVDPLHPQALAVVVVFMCKSKHCFEMAQSYLEECGCEVLMENIAMYDIEQQTMCDQLLNTMADWLTLFSYFELRPYDGSNALCVRVAKNLENSSMLRRMQTSLTEAQVVPEGTMPHQRISMPQTALLAFLYMSPRKTPAGKMLEMLYTNINSTARDAELRCLRAMTAFKDTMDDEVAYRNALPLVLLSMAVREDFAKNIEGVLRKQMCNMEGLRLQHVQNVQRPLLRTYAQNSLLKHKHKTDASMWTSWRQALNFPATTSSQMQLLLYFITVQRKTVDRELYEEYFTKEVCDKAAACTIESIDERAVILALLSLRVYQYNIKTLIDFSSKCLTGINQKTRQSLSVVQVLQLYIASFQHQSIWDKCWRQIVPTMNHTIIDTVSHYVRTNAYEVDMVVQNLLYSQIHDD